MTPPLKKSNFHSIVKNLQLQSIAIVNLFQIINLVSAFCFWNCSIPLKSICASIFLTFKSVFTVANISCICNTVIYLPNVYSGRFLFLLLFMALQISYTGYKNIFMTHKYFGVWAI